MTAKERYDAWVLSPALTEEERQELSAIREDDKQVEARFFAPLAFGTAGLRGIMGMGLNRMNRFVVGHATQAFADLIFEEGTEACQKGVAIAYDCRHHSEEYAREAACVLAANGITVHLFDAMRPTPELSFAIRTYGLTAGINITASHNPSAYNGYKVYWSDGAQLPPAHAAQVSAKMEAIDIFTGARTMPFDEAVQTGLIRMLGSETDEKFLEAALGQSVGAEAVRKVADTFKVVYTPFHGTGYKLVPEVLRRLGLKHILEEPAQSIPDGDFPTVASPNPENREGFENAIELAKQNNVDLIIGTDPDADRVGVVVRNGAGEYVTLTGNQTGVLLLDYLIRARKKADTMPRRPALIKTIVTTEMARTVAEAHGVTAFDTFTGFKFMAELIGQFEKEHSYQYLLAYEESYGYLAGDHARDKDAVTASLLIAEMAAWYRAEENLSLYEAMEALYAQYGAFAEHTINVTMEGVDGQARIKELMDRLRRDPPLTMNGVRTLAMRDYKVGTRTNLTAGGQEKLAIKDSDVLYFEMEDGTAFIARPSGTEPKMKLYILASGRTKAECQAKIDHYTDYAKGLR